MNIPISPAWVRGIFSRVKSGAFKLTLWDGKTTLVGSGAPDFQLTIKSPEVIKELIRSPQLGFAEAYMDQRIIVEGDLSKLIALAIKNETRFREIFNITKPIKSLFQRFSKPTSIIQQKVDITHHYDLGNQFYQLWLDSQMVYSCAYFKSNKDNIDQAQKQKIDHILAKLQLHKGEKLIDIGSGWGALLIAAAKKYQVHATGITLSRQQYEWTKQRIGQEKLEKQVTVEYADYREMPKRWTGRFDKWVSVGMYEHVGQPNGPLFIEKIKQVLKPNGVGLLHSIVSDGRTSGNPFLLKYIFPGGYTPAIAELIENLETVDIMILDLENLWYHYALTLDHWANRFEAHAKTIEKMYDDRFVRMWRLYLRGAAESFRYGKSGIVQVLFTLQPNPNWPLQRVK